MEDYKDMYPRPEDEQKPPEPDPPQENEQVQTPAAPPAEDYRDDPVYRSRQPQQIPNQQFYGQQPIQPPPRPPYPDPYQRYFRPAEPELPPPPKEKTAEMNKKIYIAAGALAILVFLLCVYCILADVFQGAIAGSETANHVTVRLMTQEKPDLNPDDENVTADGEYTVRGVAELVRPSIVEVYTYSGTSRRNADLVGTGSGIIISEDGYIVTNAHVVDGVAYQVTLDDEKEYDARLIGSDTKTDLAVLKIEADGLTAAVLGNSDETYVGENVVAIGNPAGLTNSVTKGIVSAIGRQIRADSNAFRMECIQTDAAISPGNSGGALVNMYGQVIGITSSKYASQYSTVYEGLGFAITINEAIPVVTDLMELGYVEGRFRIGIVFTSTSYMQTAGQFQEHFGAELPPELEDTLWITEISEDCDIHNTELQVDDFITEIEGERVKNYDDVINALDGFKGGDLVKARVARYGDDGKISYFDIEFRLEEDRSGKF